MISSYGPRLVWLSIVGVAAALIAAVCAAPLLAADNHYTAALVAYRSFGAVCHQMPERSFELRDFPLAVCARCFGLYAGFAAGALLYPAARRLSDPPPHRRWLLLALVPTALDFGLDFGGWWSNTHASRAWTGALLGAVSAFYVVPGLLDLFRTVARALLRGAERGKLPSRV